MSELIETVSPYDVGTTVDRVVAGLGRRGVPLFATIDHAAGARAAGLALDDEVVLVFGNAKVGTALMQADRRAGLDLPLRLLVWSSDGVTRVAFHDPHDLAAAHDLAGRTDVLDTLRHVLDALVAEAVGAVGASSAAATP